MTITPTPASLSFSSYVSAAYLGAPSKVLLSSSATAKHAPSVKSGRNTTSFRIIDATAYTGKPPNMGMELAYTINVLGTYTGTGIPNTYSASTLAAQLNGNGAISILDIEVWPQTGAQQAQSVSQFVQIVQGLRSAGYSKPLGYYGTMPITDYWSPYSGAGSDVYKAWQANNDAMAPIVSVVDYLYPALYTFYEDQAGWEAVAIATIAEARRISNNKPVYAFLWPQYHQSNVAQNLAYIAADYWQRQLNVCQTYADGVVIWGGWGGADLHTNAPQAWNDTAPWWLVTKTFIASNPSVVTAGVVKDGTVFSSTKADTTFKPTVDAKAKF